MVPGSCVVSDALYPVDQSSGVWTWKLKHLQGGLNQTDVHVNVTKFEKTPKVRESFDFDLKLRLISIPQELYGEVVTWAWLEHPNILPCFGITVDPFQVVTEWVPHGNVIEYVQTHPDADRVCLVSPLLQPKDVVAQFPQIVVDRRSPGT